MRLLISLTMSGTDAEQRYKTCKAAFAEASSDHIDEIRLQPAFMEQPPANVQAAIGSIVRKERRRWGRIRIPSPSQSTIDAGLEACPYVQSVVFLQQRRMVMGSADAADTIDFTTTSERWPALRLELIDLLGSGLRAHVDELRDE